MKLNHLACAAAVGGWAAFAAPAGADSGKDELRKALKDLDEAGSWIYDDLQAGFAAARTSGKPLLVVFR